MSMYKQIFATKWKTELCNQGESCWCRIISPVDIIHYTKEDNTKEEIDCIIHSGAVPKEIAEHIVYLHNKQLELNTAHSIIPGESLRTKI